ncbi:ABC transporter ATP-binding protein [Aeromicrobium halocynthiae]|uniref:ABC transporter ATP-binding protein n=1 Tax=Aeromicrobium halocynthiae TaxID=560557 RepID=A0ABN2W338_9ACTN
MTGELSALVTHLGRERRAIAGTIVLVTVSLVTLGALAVLPAYALGRAVVLGQAPPGWFWAALTGLVLLRAVLTWGEMDASHGLAYRVLARLRMALFDRYAVALPSRERENVGHAASTAMADTERLEFFYAHTVAQLVAAAVNLLLGLCVLALVSLPMAAVAVAAAGALAVTVRLHATRTQALGHEVADRTSALSARVVDALGGLREVLGYRLQERVRAEIRVVGARAAEASGRLETTARMLAALREAVVTVAAGAVLALALVGDIRAALVPAVVVLALVTIAPAAEAAETLAQLHRLRSSAGRVGAELARPPATRPVESPDLLRLPEGPLGLALQDVSFTYATTRVLEGFHLTVQPGEHVGIAGPSGAGKSTIVALAGRLWDPDAGLVGLLGADQALVPLGSVSDDELRRAIAVVEQDGRLFSGTVADNLLGSGASTRADLVAGLEQLGVAEAVGADDELGEAGVRLSGGQAARLRLLRAVLARPRVLVVDEPTADLDAETADRVHALLAALPCTVVVVSHREQTLAGADRVVRLGPGTARTTPP